MTTDEHSAWTARGAHQVDQADEADEVEQVDQADLVDEDVDWAEGWDVGADTAPETAVRSAVAGGADEPRATHTGAHARDEPAEDADRGRIPQWARRGWQVAIGDLPSPWSARPASPAEAVRYGRYGDYAAPGSRWRTAGTWYALLVAAPVTAGLAAAIWLLQRPGRLAALGLLVGLVWLFVGPGVPLTF
jgi:hypothetical protein